MGRKLVVFLLAGLLFIILLATPRASAGTDTEYLKYTIESEIRENKIMPPADSGAPQSAPAAPVTVPPPVVSPPTVSSPFTYTATVPPPDFAISITPASRTVTRGESTTYTVTVKSIGGYSGHVALSVSGLPSGAGYSLPSRVTPPANGSAVATLTVTTTTSAAAGNYTVTVTGTGSGTKTASAGLTVTAPSPPPPPPPTQPLPTIPIGRTYNFDDRRSDVPLDSQMGQSLMTNVYSGTPNCKVLTAVIPTSPAVAPSAYPSAPVIIPKPPSTPAPSTTSAPKISAAPVNSPPSAKASPPPVSPNFAALVRAINAFFSLRLFR